MVYKRINLKTVEDYFHTRPSASVYSCRIVKCDNNVIKFIEKYFTEASHCGVIIEDKIQNPDMKAISFMKEKIGDSYTHSSSFIQQKLKQWIPNLDTNQTSSLAKNFFDLLEDLKKSGRNDSVIRNVYIKMMCWMYFRFNNVVTKLCKDVNPKIIYEGDITFYELSMLKLLSSCGCDLLFLDYNNSIDDKEIQLLNIGTQKFSKDFNLSKVKSNILNHQKLLNRLGKSKYTIATNIWLTGDYVKDLRNTNRGDNKTYIYNALIKQNGVEDKTSFKNNIFTLKSDLEKSGTQVFVINSHVENVQKSQIYNMKHNNDYQDDVSLVMTLTDNIMMSSVDMNTLFNHVMYEFVTSLGNKNLKEKEDICLRLIFNLKKYSRLFNIGKFGVLIFLQTENLTQDDVYFISFVYKLGADILILNPSKNDFELKIPVLYEKFYEESLVVEEFPKDLSEASYSTVAYNAESELTEIMYQDSGLYRDMQFSNMKSVILKTTFEEIDLLWKEPLNMRIGFSTANNCVTVPTIFAKVCGVKDGNIGGYNNIINSLKSAESVMLVQEHHIEYLYRGSSYNNVEIPINIQRNVFGNDIIIRGNKIDRDAVLRSRNYRYDYLKKEVQDNIISAAQLLIDRKQIKKVFSEVIENDILSVCFGLDKDILKLLQGFDYTKVNPKVVYINSTEESISLYETILFNLLNILGFDIVMFIPTGYNVVDKYLERVLYEEYQIGEYIYNYSLMSNRNKQKSFFSQLFNRR